MKNEKGKREGGRGREKRNTDLLRILEWKDVRGVGVHHAIAKIIIRDVRKFAMTLGIIKTGDGTTEFVSFQTSIFQSCFV